jgi:hypothetical protein
VRIKISRAILAVAISSALGLGAAWAQAPAQPQTQQKQPQWKDRAEYDLVASMQKETDPTKKLALLNQWQEKYAATDFKEMRQLTFLDTYKALNQPAKMLEICKEMVADNPKNFQALYWSTYLVPVMNQTAAEQLDLGTKGANGLLGALDEVFAADKKPATTDDATWKKARTDMEALGHRTLGWISWQRKNYPEAETQLSADLKLNPGDAEASYWLGTNILAQKKPERQVEAVFQFARAAAYDGTGALDAARRKQIEAYVRKVYTTFHGSDDGFQDLMATAKANVFAPADFKIVSEAEVEQKKHDELAAKDPSLALWVTLKQALTASDGSSYFDQNMKGALVPPEGKPAFAATVISQTPEKNPKVVILGLENATTADVKLTFEEPLPGRAEPGTVLHFRGVATSFAAQPFVVTFEAEAANISGWPTPVPAKKAGGAAKKAVPKKKAE